MKHILLISFCSLLAMNGMSQENEGSEIGIDLIASASNLGGTVGGGLKYGVKFGQYFIAGPSVRYQRTWNKNNYTGTQGGFNVYGGGGFLHARFYNALFLGTEFEVLSSPYTSNGFYDPTGNSWVPTLFVGGGFSMEFNEAVRLNVGIMYDVINKANSPFRNTYFVQKKDAATGAVAGYLPIIYRIAFFFPLN